MYTASVILCVGAISCPWRSLGENIDVGNPILDLQFNSSQLQTDGEQFLPLCIRISCTLSKAKLRSQHCQMLIRTDLKAGTGTRHSLINRDAQSACLASKLHAKREDNQRIDIEYFFPRGHFCNFRKLGFIQR